MSKTHINTGLDLLIEDLPEPSLGFDQEQNAVCSMCELDRGTGSFWGNYLETRGDWGLFSLSVLEWSMPIHQNQSSLQNTVDF